MKRNNVIPFSSKKTAAKAKAPKKAKAQHASDAYDFDAKTLADIRLKLYAVVPSVFYHGGSGLSSERVFGAAFGAVYAAKSAGMSRERFIAMCEREWDVVEAT